jgi:uroporphyrinogen decarboxylase
MNSRERVLAALAHKEPDRVPVDFGSTWITTITIPTYERLKRHFGIDSPTVTMERAQQVCMVDERILQAFHVDTRGVFYGLPDLERNRFVELGENVYRDSWGITWHKPTSSHYFDMLKPALGGEITLHDVMAHQWPDPHDPGYTRGLRERVREQRGSTDCALVLNLSIWVLQCSQFVRGFEDWYVDLVAQPRLMEAIMDAITESLQGVVEDVLDEVGDLVDVVSVSDDMGSQDRTCVRPELYRKLVKPRHARLMAAIKSRTRAPVMWHTCGSVYDLLDDLVEMGMDALNPVQTDAAKMNAERLKRDYGARLTFWGGIDAIRVLPFGTRADVEEEVRSKIRAFARGGGYILNSVHNIQPNVPLENIFAMFEAARRHGRYPISG